MESNRIVIPYGNWKRQFLIGIPAILVLGFLFWMIARNVWWPGFALLLFFGVLSLSWNETIVDPTNSVVFRRWSLLKLIPLWTKRYSLTDFENISARYKDDQEGRIWYVCLESTSGKRLDLKWFGYATEFPADALNLQTRLAGAAGLPIKNDFH